MRRRGHEAHENHERWLVSYADFITLLFAFFVVMFASSQTDKAKAQQVSESVKGALEKGAFSALVKEVLGGTVDDRGKGNAMMKGPGGNLKVEAKKPEAKVAELLPSLEHLSRELSAEIEAGRIQLHMEPRGLVVSLQQAAFFPSGTDTVDPATFPSLEKIARLIATLPNGVRLEGHTDSVPIHTARFRSNWELSAARSIAMLELYSGRFKVPKERMAIAGYADTVPVAGNDSQEGRARNRRVDIVILAQHRTAAEPEAAPPPARKAH